MDQGHSVLFIDAYPFYLCSKFIEHGQIPVGRKENEKHFNIYCAMESQKGILRKLFMEDACIKRLYGNLWLWRYMNSVHLQLLDQENIPLIDYLKIR